MLFIAVASLLRSIHQAQISHLHVYSVVIRLRLSFTSISIIINSQNKAVCLSIAHARWTVRSGLSDHRSTFINVLSEPKWFEMLLLCLFLLLNDSVFCSHTRLTNNHTSAFGWQNWKYGSHMTVILKMFPPFFSNQTKVVFYLTLERSQHIN